MAETRPIEIPPRNEMTVLALYTIRGATLLYGPFTAQRPMRAAD